MALDCAIKIISANAINNGSEVCSANRLGDASIKTDNRDKSPNDDNDIFVKYNNKWDEANPV